MHKLMFVLLFTLFLTGNIVGQTVDTLVIPHKIEYAKIPVRDKVRKECQLEEKIARFMVDYTKKNGTYSNIVREKPDSGDYHVLEAKITAAAGSGGGAWSGAKSVRIEGTLKDASGKLIGNFSAGRFSGGGAFGAYKGTCSILGRCTKAIGKDVAQWLKSPTQDALLGDH